MKAKAPGDPLVDPASSSGIADHYYLETIEQLQILGDPLRYRIAVLLAKPRTGADIARRLALPRAKVHYHLKVLEEARLIRLHSIDHSQSIPAKNYVLRGRFLSFEQLMPDPERLDDSTVTAATYKAIADFLASMLSASSERILRAPATLRKDEGFWLDFSGRGTPREIASIRRKLGALKDQVLSVTRKALEKGDSTQLRRFSVTLYLTPDSEAQSESSPSKADDNAAGRAASQSAKKKIVGKTSSPADDS